MRRHFVVLPIVAIASVAGAASVLQTVPATEARQWTIDRTEAMSNTSYRFTNLHRNQALGYRAADPGLHVYWATISGTVYGGSWQFIKRNPSANVRDHRARPVANGEVVAIFSPYPKYKTPRGERTGSYLVHSSSSSTSQLTWARVVDNAHEWRIEIDASTKQMSMYNTKKKDYLVYDAADKIGWRANQAGTPGAVHDATVTMTAQPVVQGYVPFLGYFGGGVNFRGVLTEVRNPANFNTVLRFVKPNRSTQECGNPDAVISLAPGAALTAAQMTTLYGSTTPNLQNRIAFLACAVTKSNSAFINIKWRDI